MGWIALVQFLEEAEDFSILHRVQTNSGVQWVPGALSLGMM
jgi:hypothetical protein